MGPVASAVHESDVDSRADTHHASIISMVWLAGVAVVSGVGLAVAYRGGLFVSFGDPIVYISVAKSFAAGHGSNVAFGSVYTPSQLTVGGPVSHWPPLYSLLLSIDTSSILTWARILAVVLFAANVFLFGLLALRLRASRFGAVALAVVFAGLSLQLHGTVASEPLFFFLVLLGLHAFVNLMARPAVPSFAIVVAAFGLSTITRYLGEAFVIGGVIAIVFLLRQPISRRLRFGAILAVVANIPILIWFESIRNSPESLAVHLPRFSDIETALFTVAGFMIPGVQSVALRVLVATGIVVVVIAIMAIVGGSDSLSPIRNERTDYVMLVFAIVYLLFLFLSRSVVDPLIQLNARMLFLPFMLLLLWMAQNWPRFASWSAVPRSSWAPPLATVLVGLLVVTAVWTAVDAAKNVTAGNFAVATATTTSLKRAVQHIPGNSVIYSDRPDAVYFVSGRAVHLVPNVLSASTLKKNRNFETEMTSMQSELCGRPATLVYAKSNGYLEPSLSKVKRYFTMTEITSFSGWSVYSLHTGSNC
jgi:hypothetical protein